MIKQFKIQVTLRPLEKKELEEYCENRGFKEATVIHDIFTMARNGDLVTKSGKNYFKVHD